LKKEEKEDMGKQYLINFMLDKVRINILKKVAIQWLIMVCVWLTSLNAANQVDFFNDFANNSWKSLNVNLHGQNVPIEQHLVREFNTAVWGPDLQTKIDINIANLDAVVNYYQNTVNPVNWANTLINDDSPREWMRNLNLREIYRFKKFIVSSFG
jgi:hypothetical protein